MIPAKEIFMNQREQEQEEGLEMFQQREQEEIDNLFENAVPAVPALLQDSTKEDRSNYVALVLEGIESGEFDILKTQCQLKATESMIEMFTDAKKFPNTSSRYKKALLEAAAKHGKKFTFHNAEFQEKEAGVKYSFDKCNDPEITTLHAKLKTIQADVKIREEFLKNVPAKGLQILDSTTGELVTVYPPSKSSTTIIQTTLL